MSEGEADMASNQKRRDSARHKPANNETIQVNLKWVVNHIRIGPASLINFSSTGAKIHSDNVPTVYQRVQIQLPHALELVWFSGDTVRFGGPKENAVKFRRPFPLDFLLESIPPQNVALTFLNEDETRYS